MCLEPISQKLPKLLLTIIIFPNLKILFELRNLTLHALQREKKERESKYVNNGAFALSLSFSLSHHYTYWSLNTFTTHVVILLHYKFVRRHYMYEHYYMHAIMFVFMLFHLCLIYCNHYCLLYLMLPMYLD